MPRHISFSGPALFSIIHICIYSLVDMFPHVFLQGEIEEEKLDCYDVHFYAASRNEIEEEVRRQGSFELERVEMFEIEREVKKGENYGTAVAMTVRAIQESMLYNHFGNGINLDALFNNYGKMIDQEMAKQEIKPITFLLVLKKL